MLSLSIVVVVLLKGLAVTLQLTLAAAALGLPLALLAGLARLTSHRSLRWLATIYVELFRGTSALVQLFWFYFVLPLFGLRLPAFAVGALVLALNAGAYGAEIVRANVQAVPQGQRDAARALNLSPTQALWRIYLPQAVPSMIPPFGNLLIELLKNTALVSLVTITELTFSAQLLREQMLHSASIFSLVLLFYFVTSLLIMAAVRYGERLLRRRRQASPGGRLLQRQA